MAGQSTANPKYGWSKKENITLWYIKIDPGNNIFFW